MDKITITLVVLGATVLGMFNSIQVAEMINKKRDLILDIDKDGRDLTIGQKEMVLYSDYIPLSVGLILFLAVYSAAFYLLPQILDTKYQRALDARISDPTLQPTAGERWGCRAAAAFGTFALLVMVIGTPTEYFRMRTYLADLAAMPNRPTDGINPAAAIDAAKAGQNGADETSTTDGFMTWQIATSLLTALLAVAIIVFLAVLVRTRKHKAAAAECTSVDNMIQRLQKLKVLAGDKPIEELLQILEQVANASRTAHDRIPHSPTANPNRPGGEAQPGNAPGHPEEKK